MYVVDVPSLLIALTLNRVLSIMFKSLIVKDGQVMFPPLNRLSDCTSIRSYIVPIFCFSQNKSVISMEDVTFTSKVTLDPEDTV